MKKLAGVPEKEPQPRKPFSKLAIAGALLLAGCAATRKEVPPAVPQPHHAFTYDDRSAESVTVDGVKAKVFYTMRTIEELEVEALNNAFQPSDELTRKFRGDGEYYYWSAMRRAFSEIGFRLEGGEERVYLRIGFYFAMDERTHRGCMFVVNNPNFVDKKPQLKEFPGARVFQFDSFPQPIASRMTKVKILIDPFAGRPSSISAHLVATDDDGNLLGKTPEGQLAYSITYYPLSQRAYGGWSVLREDEWFSNYNGL